LFLRRVRSFDYQAGDAHCYGWICEVAGPHESHELHRYQRKGKTVTLAGSDELNGISYKVIGAALKVHARLGPGLLEHPYRRCLVQEVHNVGLSAQCEVSVALDYEGVVIPDAYRMDLLVEEQIVVEVKAVERVLPVHHAQVLTYLKLASKPLGLFFNFNTKRLPDDMKRIVNL
jgi:GxxExxY protein